MLLEHILSVIVRGRTEIIMRNLEQIRYNSVLHYVIHIFMLCKNLGKYTSIFENVNEIIKDSETETRECDTDTETETNQVL